VRRDVPPLWLGNNWKPDEYFGGCLATAMELAVVAAAQRDGELVAHLAPERTMLREPKMMGICRPASANQTGTVRVKPARGFA
jgi:hypothetical protein